MGHSLGVKGKQGRIKVGYQTAAHLKSYTLTPVGPSEWQVDGTIASVDEFWITQDAASRSLELEVGQQRWIWRTVSLAVVGQTVMGTVSGRPERR